MIIHVCSYHIARLTQSESTSFIRLSLTRGTGWLRYSAAPDSHPHFLMSFCWWNLSMIGCSTLWWLINFGMFIYQISILKQPRMNKKAWMEAAKKLVAKATCGGPCRWPPTHLWRRPAGGSMSITRIVSQPPERSSRKIRFSSKHRWYFFGVEKQYLLLLVYEHNWYYNA